MCCTCKNVPQLKAAEQVVSLSIFLNICIKTSSLAGSDSFGEGKNCDETI